MEKTVKIRYLTLRTGIATFEFVMKTVFFSFHRATIIVITLLHLLSRIISDIMQDISTPKEIVKGM